MAQLPALQYDSFVRSFTLGFRCVELCNMIPYVESYNKLHV